MIINLSEIYAKLKAWRDERHISVESQKAGYIVNVMEEFGELAQALRYYEKIKKGERATRHGAFEIKSTLGEMVVFEDIIKGEIEVTLKEAEHAIIDALCDIAVFTINAGVSIDCNINIDTDTADLDDFNFANLVELCGEFVKYDGFSTRSILFNCAILCEKYGYNFGIAMLETIKEISSRTGSYDESAKKWVKDTSDEAKAKWYKADYERARIEK